MKQKLQANHFAAAGDLTEIVCDSKYVLHNLFGDEIHFIAENCVKEKGRPWMEKRPKAEVQYRSH